MLARYYLIGFAAALSASIAFAQSDGRYPPPGASQFPASSPPSAGVDKSNSFGNELSATRPATDAVSPPPAVGGGSAPFRSPAAGTETQPKILPLNGRDTQPIRSTVQPPETPAAYDISTPNFNAPASAPGGALRPSTMMRAMMLSVPQGSELRGQPVSLMEVVSSGRNRLEQTERIEAYWDLCASVADYYLGLRELDEAKKLHNYAQQGGQAWAQIESELGVRVKTSLKSAQASQLKVAALTGRGFGNLPLPSDTPHCARYISHYDEIFRGGGPAEARELDALLPLRYAELENAATDVKNAEDHYDAISTRGDPDSLNALKLLALERRAFVQIARDYNERIARYLELASPGQLSASRLTGMLIKSGDSATATKSASPAPPLRRQSSNDASPPPTFAAGSPPAASPNGEVAVVIDGVTQASATESTAAHAPPRREKSLLVPSSRGAANYP